jgi:hypothetical protein
LWSCSLPYISVQSELHPNHPEQRQPLLYCSDPNCNYGRSEKDFAEKLQNLKKRYSFVNGFSSIYSSVLLFEREHFDKGEAIPLSEGMDVEVMMKRHSPISICRFRRDLGLTQS